MVLDENKYSPAVYKYMTTKSEQFKANRKRYYEKNKNAINEQQKEYQKTYQSNYYQNNKEKKNECFKNNYAKKYAICGDCGRNVNQYRLQQHLSTKIHQNSLIKEGSLPILSLDTN